MGRDRIDVDSIDVDSYVPLQTLQRWKIERALPDDGRGTLYEARDRRGQRRRLRVLPRARLSPRRRRELVRCQRLDHPHLARLTGFAEDPAEGLVLEWEWLDGDTVEDLMRLAANRPAAGHRQGLPTLLVLTISVQLLKALQVLHERGLVHGALTPRSLVLAGHDCATLAADPSRDARLRVVDLGLVPMQGGEPADDLRDAGLLISALATGLLGPPPRRQRKRHGPLRPLMEGLIAARSREQWDAARALAEARRLAMEHFAEWDRNRRAAARRRSRREAELRHHLTAAIYLGRVREAAWREQQLGFFLGERAAGDTDLEIAHRWLGEQAEVVERQREATRRSWRKLLLTALPLCFAALLTTLLAAVLIWG